MRFHKFMTADPFRHVDNHHGDSLILGDAANNALNAAGGNDWIFGRAGDDTINAGAGNDRVFGGAGNDVIRGGDGRDWLFGGDGDDTIYGEGGRNHLFGGAGTDKLFAGNDGDFLDAGDGRDFLYSGAGGDKFVGGEGWNCVLYVNAPEGITIDATTGHGTGWAAGDVYISDIQQVRGTEFDDVIYVSGTDLRHLKGGAGNDTLIGGAGNDVLRGDAGADRLTGGGGADMLYWRAIGEGGDVMTDFHAGAGGDFMDFGKIAAGFVAGVSNVNDFVRFVDNGTDTDVLFNADGHGNDFVQMVKLQGVSGVSVNDMWANLNIIFDGSYTYL